MPSSTAKYRLSQQPLPVVLDDAEVQQTLDFVEAMRVDKVAHSVVDRMFDQKNTSEGINIIGHLGEQAVGKVLGLPVDTEIRTGGDAGYDMTITGKTAQIKTSTLPRLIFNAKHLFSAEIAVLVQFTGKNRREADKDPQFTIWGWVEREEFLKNYYNEDFGYGLRLVMDAPYLHPLDSLFE